MHLPLANRLSFVVSVVLGDLYINNLLCNNLLINFDTCAKFLDDHEELYDKV